MYTSNDGIHRLDSKYSVHKNSGARFLIVSMVEKQIVIISMELVFNSCARDRSCHVFLLFIVGICVHTPISRTDNGFFMSVFISLDNRKCCIIHSESHHFRHLAISACCALPWTDGHWKLLVLCSTTINFEIIMKTTKKNTQKWSKNRAQYPKSMT